MSHMPIMYQLAIRATASEFSVDTYIPCPNMTPTLDSAVGVRAKERLTVYSHTASIPTNSEEIPVVIIKISFKYLRV